MLKVGWCVFEVRVMRTMFGAKRQEVREGLEKLLMRSSVMYTYRILLEASHQDGWDGWGAGDGGNV
jgi:hypothetical protein